MRVSKFSQMIPFAVYMVVLLAGLVFLPGTGVFVFPVPVFLFLGFAAVLAAVCLWAYGKYYVLTKEGIRHKFLGITYRKTPWSDVADVMCSEHPFQPRMDNRVLVITKKGVPVLRREAFRFTPAFFPQFLPGWLRGDRFVIRITGMENEQKIIPFVQSVYGPLDENYFEGK